MRIIVWKSLISRKGHVISRSWHLIVDIVTSTICVSKIVLSSIISCIIIIATLLNVLIMYVLCAILLLMCFTNG